MMNYHIAGGVFLSESKSKSFDLRFLPRAISAWIVCAVILLFCAGALFASGAASLSALGYCSSAISFFAAAGAGAAAVSECRDKRAILALLSALSLIILLLLVGFLVRGRLEGDAVSSVVCFTSAGCLVGAMLRAPKKRRTVLRRKVKKRS